MKTSISKTEYLQIVGLLTLAEKHAGILEDILHSLEEITGDTDNGHCSDAIYTADRRNADALLKRLKINVEES